MELNRKAEVSLHGQAADIEWTLERDSQGNWEFNVKNKYPHPVSPECETWKQSFTSDEAAMMIALFIDGEDCLLPSICREFYDRLEPKLVGCPFECRIIP